MRSENIEKTFLKQKKNIACQILIQIKEFSLIKQKIDLECTMNKLGKK